MAQDNQDNQNRDAEPPDVQDTTPPTPDAPDAPAYTRREALAALARYSAAVGGAATTIVTAEGLVSSASAYPWPPWLDEWCRRHPNSPICTWSGWEYWGHWGWGGWHGCCGHKNRGIYDKNGNGGAGDRIRY